MKIDKKSIAILVISCDNYEDLWFPFFEFFSKSWKDCPYKVFLQTNLKDFKTQHKVNIIKVGEDKSWSDNVIKAIEHLNDFDYLILFLEDMMIDEKVNNKRIEEILSDFFNSDGNFLSLLNEPKPTKNFNKNFGIIEKGALYRSTATATIWKKSVLKELLVSGESAWSFEKNGSKRSDKFSNFFSVHKDEIKWINAVIKNKWTYEVIQKFKKYNIDTDLSKRKKINLINTIFSNIYLMIRRLVLSVIPFKLHRKLFQKYSS